MSENGFGDVEEFEELSYDEKWEYLISWMIVLQKSITKLAHVIADFYNEINESGERIEGVAKAVAGVVATDEFVKDVLKGKSRSALDKRFWTKETSKLKKMTGGWYVV